MPRLDNSSDEIIEHFELNYDSDDPGKTPPLDFCADCWLYEIIGLGWEGMEIEHPSYAEDDYYCHLCEVPLDEGDNEY